MIKYFTLLFSILLFTVSCALEKEDITSTYAEFAYTVGSVTIDKVRDKTYDNYTGRVWGGLHVQKDDSMGSHSGIVCAHMTGAGVCSWLGVRLWVYRTPDAASGWRNLSSIRAHGNRSTGGVAGQRQRNT